MKTVSSYGVELRKQNIPVRQTLDIYRTAVSCLTGIYAQIWDELAVITELKKRFNTAEHLVHTTKKNQARFDFDRRFPKMPSYLRRAAIQHALGSVSSYKTRLELWEKTDQKGGRPKLVCDNHAMPVFYRDVMYREDTEERDGAYLKLMMAMTGNGSGAVSAIQIWNISERTGLEKKLQHPYWKKGIVNTSCVFLIQKRCCLQRHLQKNRSSAVWI